MKGEKATKEQIKEAFRKAIERWEMIVEDAGHYDKTSCSLCNLGKDDKYDYSCNVYCPIRDYGTGNHAICHDTPYSTFYNDRTRENAIAELSFLREVYLDFLENEIQEQLDELGKAIKVEAEEKEEWVDITKKIEWRLHQPPCAHSYWVRGYYEGEPIVWLDNDGIDSFSSRDTKIEKSDMSFNVLKRIRK